MQRQRGAGKAGTGALPSHSHLEFAMHRLLAPAGSGDSLGWVAEAWKVWVRVVRGGRFPMDHWKGSQEEEMALGRLSTLPASFLWVLEIGTPESSSTRMGNNRATLCSWHHHGSQGALTTPKTPSWDWTEQLLGASRVLHPRNASVPCAPEKKPFAIAAATLCMSEIRLLRAQLQSGRARALHGQRESCEKCSCSLLRCLEAA